MKAAVLEAFRAPLVVREVPDPTPEAPLGVDPSVSGTEGATQPLGLPDLQRRPQQPHHPEAEEGHDEDPIRALEASSRSRHVVHRLPSGQQREHRLPDMSPLEGRLPFPTIPR